MNFQNIKQFVKENFSYLAISSFWLFTLMNPVFKKFDYGAEFPSVVAFAVIVFLCVLFEFKNKRERSLTETISLVVFAIFVGLSFVFSQTRNTGLGEALAFISIVPFYLLFSGRKIEWRENFLKVVGLGTLFAVIFGFIIYLFKDQTRMIGPFFNKDYYAHQWPNAFALYLVTAWPVFLILVRKKTQRWAAVFLSIIFTALLLTYSRGALIALAGQLLLVAIYYVSNSRFNLRLNLNVILTIVLTVGLFYVTNYVRAQKYETVNIEERINFGDNQNLTSKQERMDFWVGAIKLAEEKPITGFGPFSFRYAYNGIQKTLLGSADHSHNVFLKIAAENGLVALAGFLIFLLAVFAKILTRFKKLSSEDKDFVYLLSVAVLGSFAHNMIDYNLNFLANFLLLIIFITLISSVLSKEPKRESKPYILLASTLLIAVFAIYQGIFFVLSLGGYNSFAKYYNFPRDYYNLAAEKAISEDSYFEAKIYLEEQLSLNTLDAKSYYLLGKIYCDQGASFFDPVKCKESLAEAIKLDPMNDFSYYKEYVRNLNLGFLTDEDGKVLEKVKILLNQYFYLVEYNVHFTSYTNNVESAYELIDLMSPYLTGNQRENFTEKRDQMMKTATRQRLDKTFN